MNSYTVGEGFGEKALLKTHEDAKRAATIMADSDELYLLII